MPALRAATAEEALHAAFAIGRQSAIDLEAVDLGAQFLRTLADLLPGRAVAVRLVDPRTLELRSMECIGQLKPGAHRSPIVLKLSALKRTRLPESIAASGRVQVQPRYQPLFEQTAAGFAVPLAAGGELLGAINVELPDGAATVKRGQALLAADEAVVISLANQLAVALRDLGLLAEARREQQRLQTILARANVLIAQIDTDGRVVIANDALLGFFGISGSELRTLTIDQWMASQPHVPEPRLGSIIRRALAGATIETEEAHLGTRDGQVKRAMWSITPLRDARGAVDSVIVVGHDLERMRALERQVIQSEKLATLGQLAAGVVHELNNPLTSIGVYAEYLARRLDADGADKAHKILEGAERIRRLTQDLVSYARPSGERAALSLNDVVAQALSFCEHVIGEAGAALEVSYDPELPAIEGLRRQLQQVVINLVTNACHAVAGHGARVRVQTARGAGGAVLLEVSDDGVGIEPHLLTRVFDPFFTTKREGKGTGLGLSIVKNIVEAHGGRIAVESRPGRTHFTIALPASSRTERETEPDEDR